jgi:hypothetical protein
VLIAKISDRPVTYHYHAARFRYAKAANINKNEIKFKKMKVFAGFGSWSGEAIDAVVRHFSLQKPRSIRQWQTCSLPTQMDIPRLWLGVSSISSLKIYTKVYLL